MSDPAKENINTSYLSQGQQQHHSSPDISSSPYKSNDLKQLAPPVLADVSIHRSTNYSVSNKTLQNNNY